MLLFYIITALLIVVGHTYGYTHTSGIVNKYLFVEHQMQRDFEMPTLGIQGIKPMFCSEFLKELSTILWVCPVSRRFFALWSLRVSEYQRSS